MNFGVDYRVGKAADRRTGLRLVLEGFNAESREYTATGAIQLLDGRDNLAAAWPFEKLMDHWKKKHAQAAFVPSERQKEPSLQYRFSRQILLGEGAEFGRLLNAVHEGRVYYDPGIKLEDASTNRPRQKTRSQFRVASKDLPALYERSRIVDACEEANS